jgi:hypothetical protein
LGKLQNLLLLLSLKVLIYGVLHGVNSLLESRIPVVLDSIVSSTHQLLGDEAPFFLTLISEDEKNPLFFLRPFCPLNLRI